MATRKSIIPEFMKNNPNDTFQFLFPLKIVLDEDKYGNSHYEVVVKNITKKELFKYRVSPELLFSHYQFLEYYKNGKKVDTYKNEFFEEKSFKIDTKFINRNNEKKLKDILDDNNKIRTFKDSSCKEGLMKPISKTGTYNIGNIFIKNVCKMF